MSSGPGRGAARRTVAGVAQDIVLRTCPGVSAATWRAAAIRTLALIAMFATLAKRPRAPSPGSPLTPARSPARILARHRVALGPEPARRLPQQSHPPLRPRRVRGPRANRRLDHGDECEFRVHPGGLVHISGGTRGWVAGVGWRGVRPLGLVSGRAPGRPAVVESSRMPG